MKRTLFFITIMLSLAFPLFSQIDYASFKEDFDNFAEEVVSNLPFNSTIGLGWSDAYIGQLPNFGIGFTAGCTTIPFEIAKAVTDQYGSLADGFPNFFQKVGMPLPAYTFDFRLGGFSKLPFDMGVKFGIIPKQMIDNMDSIPDCFTMDYLLVGGDIRFALLQETKSKFTPDLSLGFGINFMKGGIGIENFTSDQTIDLSAYGLSNLTITSPELFFQWKALVLEGKLQLSKDLSIITLMMGAGISYAVYAEAGGGLRSEVLYGGVPITEEDIENIKSILGPDAPELNKKSITVLSEVKGWSIRVFGGLTINIFFFKIDFNVMYNFMTKGFGASLNMRFQFSPREKKKEKKEEEKKEE